MNEQLMIAPVLLFVGWCMHVAWTHWTANKKSRVIKETLANIEWLKAQHDPAQTLEQKAEAEKEAKLVAALTAVGQ